MIPTTRKLLATALVLSLGTLGACGTAQAPMTQPAAAQARMAAESGQHLFTDANIAAVMTAVNLMEIEPSNLALERGQEPEVRSFANRMVKHHTRVQQQMQQLLAAKGLVPTHNALSLQLTRNLEPTLASLNAVPARQFDEDYVLQQISAHEVALHSLDTTLIPMTRDADMRNWLANEVRPAIAEHLVQIRQIHHRMASPRS